MKTAAEMSAISAVVAAMALLFPGPVCASEEKADVLTQTALHMAESNSSALVQRAMDDAARARMDGRFPRWPGSASIIW
jgi:hypothetical protein